jgi:DNA-binding LacI/PurR family transcriptional regulator
LTENTLISGEGAIAARSNCREINMKFEAITIKDIAKALGLSTSTDKLSTGCLAALARKKVKVPEEMGIVGFTNSQLTDIFHPALTSIRQPAFEMGQVAMEMLVSLIESKRPVTTFETRALNTELTVRSSRQKI